MEKCSKKDFPVEQGLIKSDLLSALSYNRLLIENAKLLLTLLKFYRLRIMKLTKIALLNFTFLTLFTSIVQAQSTPPPTIINNTPSGRPNSLTQKLTDWGFTIIRCDINTAQITDLATTEQACVKTTEQLNAGNYIYDPNNNQIRPEPDFANTAVNPNRSFDSFVNPTPNVNDPRIADVVLDFNNIYDYNNCLDAMLLLYEGRNPVGDNSCLVSITNTLGYQINQNLMLELIDLANFRATNLLPKRIYPAYGIRRRIAQSIGYVYEIDLNNQEMIGLTQSRNVYNNDY